MSAQKLKQLLHSEQIQQCADLANKLLQTNANDKVALFFLAQCQLKSGQLQESQTSLNQVYGLVQKGTDDALLFNAYQCQEQLAIKLQESPQKKVRQTGRDIQLSNKFQIIDFLDKKQKYDKMVEETDTYCLLLLEDSRYKEIEDTYLWLMNHKALTDAQKVTYGAKIFEIDQFYNPYTRLDALFPRLCKMDPTSPALKTLAIRMLDVLDKQGGKKSVYSAVQLDSTVQQFVSYNEQLKVAGSHIFTKPQEIFKDKYTQRMFTRYLAAIAISTNFLSEDWTKLESKIKMLMQSGDFQKAVQDDPSMQVFLWSFIDVAKFVREARIPSFDELEISKLPLSVLLDALTNFSKEYQDYAQYVNAYFAIVATATLSPIQIEASSTHAKIQQSQFICRKAQFFKLTNERDISDLQLYLSCLLLKLPLDKEQANQSFTQAEILFEKHQNNCSPKVCELFTSLTSELKWQADLKQGKWLKAIEGLEFLAKQNSSKADFVTVKKSQIQLCHLREIVKDSSDQEIFVQGVMNSIQSVGQVEGDNLLLQGYLMWTYPQLFKCDQKQVLNKWLQALKKDQTNPEIYFALAVYYYTIKDLKRASGCLDKVLKLKPDFEQALVLSYQVAQSSDARLQLVDKFMETNRNVAVTYFFRGLLMHQRQDWFQAIEMYQNAIKFYGIQNSKQSNLLLPRVELSIFENPFGIYGSANAAVCCVYLSECFMKIDKPQVALKCFTQGVEEMSKVKLSEQVEMTTELDELIEILSLPQLQPNSLEIKNDPILSVLQNLQPSKWVLECLMLGSRLVTSPQTAISILTVALKCKPTQSMLSYILTELLAKVTILVEQGVIFENGRVQLLAETPAVIDRLDQLVAFVAKRPQFMTVQNLQKRRLNALFAIAQRTMSKDRFQMAMETASTLVEASFPGWQTLILDYAKIIHEYQRFDDSDQTLQDLKVTLIKKAIVQDPQQANLWVHLHMFSTDEFVKARAIFKAYELEPESSFVQEMILKFYLNTKQWQKAFKIIVRSYQRATTAGEPQQPIVLATLAYMNAVCYFQTGQRAQLLEALSLIRLLQREDMIQILSEVYIYLSHYNGDYMKTLSFLQTRPKTEIVDLLLLKAYFGSTIYSYEQVRAKADENAQKLLNHVFEVDSLSENDLKQVCQQEILSFVDDPKQVAPMLALHQELCLQRKVLPQAALLDQVDVRSALQLLDTNSQRILLIQGLRLVQLRDGKIKEAQAIIEDPLKKKVDPQDTETPAVSYTVFILEAARLKPQYLTSSQHKALLRLYFKSKEASPTFPQGLFNDQNIRNQAEVSGLRLFLKKRNEQSEFGLGHLMRDPLSIKANSKWLWSLLKAGKVTEALQAFNLMKTRLDLGILTGDRSHFDKLSQFMDSLSQKESQMEKRLELISGLCSSLEGCEKPETIDVRTVACHIVQTLSSVSDSAQTQDQLIQVIFQVMQLVLFEQGHYQVYNKLVKEILNAATVLHKQDSESDYSKEGRLVTVWNYSLLQLASSLTQLKKHTQVIPLIKEIESLPKGQVEQPLAAAMLLKARASIAADNYQQVNLQKVDTFERDYLQALTLYGVQEYSQYYLACLGIVAGAKQADSSQWDLAYAYYLKAFGEMTFLMAKRQDIKLKDDFTKEEADKYNEAFFARKVTTSLGKCQRNLEAVGERDGMLWKACQAIIEQI